MSETDRPVARSIGLSGIIRWLIFVAAVIAVVAAYAAGNYALVAGALVFLAAAAAGIVFLAKRPR